jgi:hypothetical protein
MIFILVYLKYITIVLVSLIYLMIKETSKGICVLHFERAKYLESYINKVKRNNV